MQDKVGFIKATVIGGVFFLIPLAIISLMVGKLAGVMRAVVSSLSPLLPVHTLIGTIVLNLLALLVILGLCFLAGLVAQRGMAKKWWANSTPLCWRLSLAMRLLKGLPITCAGAMRWLRVSCLSSFTLTTTRN